MKNIFLNFRRAIALILISIGILILLQNTGIAAGEAGNVVSTVVLTGIGIFFIALNFPKRRHWFWITIGLLFFSFALGNIVYFFPNVDEYYRQVIILGGLGISFLTIYLHNRIQWWAMFPAGLFLSIGASRLVELLSPNLEPNGIVIAGLGLAFLVLYLVPTPLGKLKFALFPALVLLSIGIALMLAAFFNFTDILLPGVILLAGVVLILVTLRKKI